MKKLFDDLLKSGSGKSSIVFQMFVHMINAVVMVDFIVIGTFYLITIGKTISETLVGVLIAGVTGIAGYSIHSKVKQNGQTITKSEVKDEPI